MNRNSNRNFNPRQAATILVTDLTSGQSALARFIRRWVKARRRQAEQEREFYRKLAAYCRSNNLPSHCEDDWKVAAHSQDR